MNRYARWLLSLVIVIQGLLALGFILQPPALLRLWPLPDTAPLTFLLIASILLAAVASQAYCLLAREYAGLAGIGLDYAVIFAPLTIYFAQLGLWPLAALGLGSALFGIALFAWSMRLPFRHTARTPLIVLISFGVFVAALIGVGTALITRRPYTLPWLMSPELTIIAGWMFLGAAAYFGYGLVRPRWGNAAGQLAGFLAYDMVLIIPFVLRLPNIAPTFRTSQIIYLVVVVYSGLLALYFLFIHPRTRLFRRPAA